jgi:hypothetical protein
MKEKMVNYLRDFLIQNEWMDDYTKKQARAIFTTICLMGNIDADTMECDNILLQLYQDACIDKVASYDEDEEDSFYGYMVGLIV